MESIKGKMLALEADTELMETKAKLFEEEAKKSNIFAHRNEELVKCLQKKLNELEAQYDANLNKYLLLSSQLEKKERQTNSIENKIGASLRKISLLNEGLERTEDKLAVTLHELHMESKRVEKELGRIRQEKLQVAIESETMTMEKQLRNAKELLTDLEGKYDDNCRKLGIAQSELEKSIERAESNEMKILCIEDELKEVGNRLQILEVAEEKISIEEDALIRAVCDLQNRLKDEEARAQNAEMHMNQLRSQIDELEDELLDEKRRVAKVSSGICDTLDQMETY